MTLVRRVCLYGWGKGDIGSWVGARGRAAVEWFLHGALRMPILSGPRQGGQAHARENTSESRGLSEQAVSGDVVCVLLRGQE